MGRVRQRLSLGHRAFAGLKMSSVGVNIPPTAATHMAGRVISRRSRNTVAMAMTAAIPAAPPTKKYKGISHVQTGGLSAGIP